MMNDGNVIDVSGFFVFEATGDSSEVQYEDSADHEWGDDDAQSCSGRDFGEIDDADEVKRVSRSKKLMRPLGVVRTTTRIKSKKSKVCNLEMMSEKDRDRLFWEACLSSS
nr:nucleosome assembly protein 1 [Ipomoea batatas]